MGEGINQKPSGVKSEEEVSNVDLQFMGRTDEQAELDAAVKAESKPAGSFEARGMDKQDVAVAQSMDASDPPSTNMGDQNE